MAKYERPHYQVLEKNKEFEIRHYDAFSTSMVQESKIRGYSGFGELFRYISGDNETSQPIAMTVPVFSERGETSSMEFVIPKEIAASGIPKPNNPNVSIRHYEPHTMAVIRHRGRLTNEVITTMEQQLRESIKQYGYTINGTLRIAQYDGPYVPVFLRTSEVLLPIEKAS
jgi:hypothetical protein